MLTKMNQKFLNLGNFDKVKLLRAFVNPSVINQSNKEFKKQLTLLTAHIAGFKFIASYCALLKLENKDVAKYLRNNNMKGNSIESINALEKRNIGEIFRDIGELRDEGLLSSIEANEIPAND